MNCINKLIIWLKSHCNKQINEQAKTSKYHSLTPINCVENGEVYMEALEQALQHPDVKNIAITGPYGSGKSSVIRTFFANRNEHKKYNPITITLANFDTSVLGKQGEEETNTVRAKIYGEKLEQLIERSIVQQLFYHEKDENLPESHFKKIRKEARWKKILGTLHILLIILSAVILVFPKKFWDLPLLKEVSEQCQNIVFITAWFYAIFGGFTIIYVIRKLMLQVSAMKFRVENAEIELNKNANKSILNHYLDEIIYFFEETRKNVVILEDLDRFEHYEIFTKLREINYLINNCEKVSHKQKVVFIYALRDDIFKDTERTKFFDFILPILPVINYSNSGEILRRELPVKPKAEIKDNCTEIAEELIDNVSLFIDDMRLVYNIVNEYKIYSGVLLKSKLIANRLFAIIVYKNLYPHDFTKLGQNKGELYGIIREQVKTCRKVNIEKNQKQIQEKQLRLKEIDSNDRTILEKELRLVYLNQIVQHQNRIFAEFDINQKKYTISQCAENEALFEQIISKSNAQYTYQQEGNYYKRTINLDFNWDAIQKEVNPKLTYKQRLAMLCQSEVNALQQDIKSLEQCIEDCKQWTICDLLEHEILKIELTPEETNVLCSRTPENEKKKEKIARLQKQHDFIRIALSNDYINENYWEYISIFHEGSLTPSDKEFVINVKVRRNTPYNHPLNRKDNVLKALTKEHSTRLLGETWALNNDLMDYILLETSELYTAPYLRTAIQKRDFIVQYIDRGMHLDLFFNQICARWPQLWHYICEHKPNETDKYLRLILENTLVENVVHIFRNNAEYINRYADFMLMNIDEQKKHDLIDELNLKFKEINQETSLEDKKYIYETWAFDLLSNVIPIILSAFPQWNEQLYNTRNYSYIKEAYPKLFEYIQNNIEKYIENIFIPLEKNQYISQEDFVELLNNENITTDQKKQIIVQCDIRIEDISIVNSIALRGEICCQNKMQANWKNIKALVYSEEINFAEVYTRFLNNEENAKQLSNQKLEEDMNLDEGKDEIAYTLIYNPNLKDRSYQLLLNSFTGVYSLQTTDLSENRMRWLLEKNLVEINADSYKYLKEHYTPLHIDFLEKHLADFSKSNYQNMDFDAEDMKPILNLNIEVSEKIKIIDSIVDTSIFDNQDEVIQLLASIVLYHFKDHQPKTNIIEYLSLQKALTVDIRKRIYIKYAQCIKDITAFLTNLEEPYSSLLQKDADTYIPMDDKVFLDTLKEHQHIGPFKKRRNHELWIIKKDAKLFR